MVLEGLKNSSGCMSPLDSLAYGDIRWGIKGLEADTPAPGDFYNFSMKITQFQAYLSLNCGFKIYSDDS